MPIPRLQNCYKHPKKFLWRSGIVDYDSAENSSDKNPIPDIVPPEDKSDKMSPTLDVGIKPTVKSEQPTSVSRPSEDTPLDFSLKTKAHELENEFEKKPKHSPPSVAFPGMINGNHRTLPSPYNNLAYPNSHAMSGGNDRHSPDADWSQSSNDSTPRMENGFDGKIVKPSPGCPSAYSDDSPNRHPSLLQELLTTEHERKPDAEQSNPLSPPFPHINGSHGIPGVPLFTTSSPSMIPTGSSYPLYKFMPQVSPAFAFGYPNPRAQLMPGYLPQFTESGFVESPAGRKTNKRKMDFSSDPFKSCSVDELQNNLRSIEIVNPYMNPIHPLAELMSPGRLPSDQVSALSPSSPESVRSAITHHNAAANGRSVSAPNSSSSTPVASHGNSSAINDNHGAMNGLSQTSSGNESVTSAIAESSDRKEYHVDGRKRKTIPESEKNEAYYARRSKNNEAARKSRETRRKKEELVKRLCSALDSSNKALKHEMSLMMCSLEQAQRQSYALATENDSLKIQNTLLKEKLKQKKCGQCGSTLPSVN